MNYTQNYHLPQWALNDRIMMDDFNNAMASMENGMTSAAATAAEAKQTSAEAKRTAAEAMQLYTMGTYVGNGGEMTITLGFQPRFLFIAGISERFDALGNCGFEDYAGMTSGGNMPKRIQITSTGFILHAPSDDYNRYPDFTCSGRSYDYIAFK